MRLLQVFLVTTVLKDQPAFFQNFSYHMKLTLTTFALSALLAMITALLTVSYQSIRATRVNPVESLKYE